MDGDVKSTSEPVVTRTPSLLDDVPPPPYTDSSASASTTSCDLCAEHAPLYQYAASVALCLSRRSWCAGEVHDNWRFTYTGDEPA